MFRSFFSSIIGLTCLTVLVPAHGFEFTSNPDFLPVHEAFVVSVTGTPDSVRIRIVAAPGYYLYKSKLSFQTQGNEVVSGPAVLPAGELKEDPYFGNVVVYHGTMEARLPVQNHGPTGFDVQVGFQGCAEKGLCYPPDKEIIHIGSDAGNIAASGWSAMSVLSAFISGLMLFLSSGVLPAVPLLALVLVRGSPSAKRGLNIGLAFTAPMVAGVVALNSAVALMDTGVELQSFVQSVWMLVPAVLVLLGLVAMTAENRASSFRTFITSSTGASLLGLLSLIYTSPYTSSTMAAVMLYIKAGGDRLGGIAQLIGLASGMSSPLVMISVIAAGLLPAAGKWSQAILSCTRVLLAIVAAWVLGRILSGPATLGLYGLVAVWSAATLGVFGSLRSTGALPAKAAAFLLLSYGIVAWAGMLKGESSPFHPLGSNIFQAIRSPEQPWVIVTTPQQLATALNEARTAGSPAIVEWSADWAPGSAQVADAARDVRLVRDSLTAFKTIRVDLTHGGQSARSLLELNGLLGPACVQVYASDGVEVQSARLVGVNSDFKVLASLTAVELHSDK
jgi:thiol:disulfide interchange protein DsbD